VNPGTLHLVAVPIGHPDDITVRALRVLVEVGTVAAEDTRSTRALLAHHGLRARLVSYHDHNERSRAPELIAMLHGGTHVALVSESGTPLLNDPGWHLVRACIDEGIPVAVVPGACAAVAALVGSGLPLQRFAFLGFVPRGDGARGRALAEAGGMDLASVFYESPRRLPGTLEAIAEALPGRTVVVARNLTQAHEQWLRGTAAEVRDRLGGEIRGQVVLLIGPPTKTDASASAPSPDAEIDALLAAGHGAKEIAARLAAASGLSRREVYARVVARRA
jgi:16S rRNA (cytidine1402-2'-O)-methyltransferase